MLSLFITVTAWLALIMIVGGIVQLMLKPNHAPQLVAVQVIASVAGILISVGILARTEMSISLPLSLIGFVLAILALVLRLRYRSG